MFQLFLEQLSELSFLLGVTLHHDCEQEVNHEKGANEDDARAVRDWQQLEVRRVHQVVHIGSPAVHRHHLEHGQTRLKNIVELRYSKLQPTLKLHALCFQRKPKINWAPAKRAARTLALTRIANLRVHISFFPERGIWQRLASGAARIICLARKQLNANYAV